jgi:hypothetical protein
MAATKKNPANTENKNTELNKTENIHIRCTPAQKKIIEDKSSREGLGAGTWLLRLGLIHPPQEIAK